MNETQRALAEYKAQIDAKYARMKNVTLKQVEKRRRHDHWLLISPSGEIDGVLIRTEAASATEAFEDFYPKKRDRIKAAKDGWHIEQDDVDGTRFNAWRKEFKEGCK